MNEEEKKAIEELKKLIDGPCEICKFCEGAYKLNRKNIKCLLNCINKIEKENEKLKAKIDVCDWQEKSRKKIIESKYMSKQKIKNEIAKLQEKYNKLDEKIELYLNKKEKTIEGFYESRLDIGELQNISYFIQTLEEILGEKKGK